jgi:flagellar motor switch protein FliM
MPSKNTKIKIHRTIIAPVVSYRCGTSSHALREGQRLTVFEKRVLRRIFGPMCKDVTVGWRKLNRVEPKNLCSLPNVIWIIK